MIKDDNEYQSILNTISYALIESDKLGFDSIMKRDANLLGQRILMNTHSINQLLQGTSFTLSNKENISLPDISSIMSLFRTQIEAYASFHHLFINETENETKLYYNLWCLSGLSQRAHIEVDQELHHKKELNKLNLKRKNEAQKILEIKKSIQNNPFVINLPKITIDKLNKHIEKNRPKWEVKFVDNKLIELKVKEVLFNTGIKPLIFEKMYNLLSWYTHPNYLSIIQLKDMYGTGYYKEQIRIIMNHSAFFLCFLINDYFDFFNDRKEIFNKLPKEFKTKISFFHSTLKVI